MLSKTPLERRDQSPIRSLGASLMASRAKIDIEPSVDPTVLQSSSPSIRDLSPTRSPSKFPKKDPYLADENIKLVPCRWSNSGWKYVKEEPQSQKFFNSPNRVNTFGFPKSKSVIK